MIELRPHRGTVIAPSDKDKKMRLAGHNLKGKRGYSWIQNAHYVPVGPLLFCGLLVAAPTPLIIVLRPNPDDFIDVRSISLLTMLMLGVVLLFHNLIIDRFWQSHIAHRVKPPTLLISDQNLHRGQRFGLLFRQPVTRNLVIETCQIEILTQEWVRWEVENAKHPTDTKTVETRYHAAENTNQHITEDRAYEQRLVYTIPMDAMHSFALPDNRLTWLIRVNLKVKDFMPLTETYAIQVTPEVHTL
jgi:hypothetical protein